MDDQPGTQEFESHEAAALLEQTTRSAERQFELRRPLLMVVGAAVVLLVYGVLWLSVRHQHPYTGPTGVALGVLYGTLAVWIAFVSVARWRAHHGVSGQSVRERKITGAAFAVIWVAVYVFQGALEHAGASDAIVYGIYPATAPFIIVGSGAAAYMAARQDTRSLACALGAIVLGVLAAFFGPAAVWGVMGIGSCALLLAYAASLAWPRHA